MRCMRNGRNADRAMMFPSLPPPWLLEEYSAFPGEESTALEVPTEKRHICIIPRKESALSLVAQEPGGIQRGHGHRRGNGHIEVGDNSLYVAQSDLGRVIGRQGRTAKAIRALLSACATRMKKRAVLEILE